jgi:hypothetical protein
MYVGIEIAPYFEFRTVQIEASGHQNIWIDIQEGLSVIYGLNGTGKTTVINGINRLLMNNLEIDIDQINLRNLEFHPGRSRGYFGFPISLILCEAAHDVYSEYNPEGFSSPGRYELDLEESGLPIERPEVNKQESIVKFKSWYLDEWLGKTFPDKAKALQELEDLRKTLGEETDSFDSDDQIEKPADEVFLNLAVGLLLDEAVDRQGHALFSPFAAFYEFIDNLRTSISEKFIDWEYSKPNSKYANELGRRYGIELGFDEKTFSDRGFGDSTSSELLDLYLYLLIEKFHNVVSRNIDDSEWFTDDDTYEEYIGRGIQIADMIQDVSRIGKTIFEAIQESFSSPVFWFEPSNRRKERRRYGLSIDLSLGVDAGKKLISFKELLSEIKSTFASEENPIHSGALFHVLSESNLLTMNGLEKFDSFADDWPYININYPDGIGELDDFPIAIVDLAQSVDFDSVAQSTLSQLLNGEGVEASFSLDGYIREGVIELPDIDLVNAFMDKVTDFLVKLDIGITRCRFEFSEDLRDWATGRAAKFTFETVSTRMWDFEFEYGIPFSQLSAAQQYWTRAAFWLISSSTSDDVFLVTADEPESGLHERAVIQVFNELSRTISPCIVTSHSSRALRLPNAKLFHLERTIDGRLLLGRPWLGDDVASAAERLGTTTFDLFALKRALVIVEGSHDVEIVKGLASLRVDGALLDKLLIVPARGVKNVATVADSVVITEFTSLHVLAITDNGRAEKLRDFVSKASDALQNGASPGQAIAVSGIREVDREATFEERVMHDLIERAIHRGMLHRLHIYALPAQDIVDLLPEKSFGLEGTWEELRDEHRSFPVRMSFKDWLRQEKGVSVSVKSVRKAFDSIDALSAHLQEILNELEIVSSLSPLEGNQ